MNVRLGVGVNVKAFNPMEIEVATDMQDDENLQTKGEIIRASNVVFEGEREMTVRDQVEVPTGKPPIADVLKIDTRINEREIMMLENKIVIKGDIDVMTLYSSVDFAAADGLVDAISPVPGGVGTVTTSVLLKHVTHAAAKTLPQ